MVVNCVKRELIVFVSVKSDLRSNSLPPWPMKPRTFKLLFSIDGQILSALIDCHQLSGTLSEFELAQIFMRIDESFCSRSARLFLLTLVQSYPCFGRPVAVRN